MEPITIQTVIEAPRERVWSLYNDPAHVTKWNSPSDEWHTPSAENDLREGGKFNYRMEARDGSAGFDFTGTNTAVVPNERIAYTMDDGRKVEVLFTDEGDSTRVVTTFDPETENSLEMQRDGWQAILDNFKKYVEGAVS